MGNEIPTRRREQVHDRDLHHCFRCGSKSSGGGVHHRRRRRVALGHDQHCPCNLIWVCRTCHEWIHKHPLAARREGWIVSASETNPAFVPTRFWNGQRVTLECDGEMSFVIEREGIGP